MNDLQQQLEALRERVARVNQRFAEKHANSEKCSGAATEGAPDPHEHGLSGQPVETGQGSHWEAEMFYPSHRRHGSADIGALADLPDHRAWIQQVNAAL